MLDKFKLTLPGDDESNPISLYANQFSFMNRKLTRDLSDPDIDVVLCGVPYDLATSGKSGTRMGPGEIRRSSSNLSWEVNRWPWGFNAFDNLGVIDYGDIDFEPGNSKDMDTQLQKHAGKIIDSGKTMLTLGGDHYITMSLIREHAKKHGPLALIHFDAHTDDYHEETPYSHGTMFHQAVKEDLVIPANSTQVGIRTEYDQENTPFKVLDADWVNDRKADEVTKEIRQIVGNRPAYISFDIDCLDPAFAPGTGTPVIGGLTSDMALKIMRGLQGLNLIGMDLVETSPPLDHGNITSLASATIALEFIYILAAEKQAGMQK